MQNQHSKVFHHREKISSKKDREPVFFIIFTRKLIIIQMTMKRIIFILVIVLPIMFLGCGNRSNSNQANYVTVDSVALKDSILKAGLIKSEGIKAVGNINFFITENEFNTQEKLFKEPLKTKDIYKNGYFLGDYNFWGISGKFFNDSLFNVQIRGAHIKYDDYNSVMPKQYESLLSILTDKYGKPSEQKELPSWNAMSNNSTWVLAEWNLGFKNIFVFINCFGVDYRLDFCYYVPELAKKSNQEKEKESVENNKSAVEAL